MTGHNKSARSFEKLTFVRPLQPAWQISIQTQVHLKLKTLSWFRRIFFWLRSILILIFHSLFGLVISQKELARFHFSFQLAQAPIPENHKINFNSNPCVKGLLRCTGSVTTWISKWAILETMFDVQAVTLLESCTWSAIQLIECKHFILRMKMYAFNHLSCMNSDQMKK